MICSAMFYKSDTDVEQPAIIKMGPLIISMQVLKLLLFHPLQQGAKSIEFKSLKKVLKKGSIMYVLPSFQRMSNLDYNGDL